MRTSAAALAVWVTLTPQPAHSETACDALVLSGVDVSDSITGPELLIQVDGISQAIQSPHVVSAIQSGEHKCVAFMVYLWASNDIVPLTEWAAVGSAEDAAAFVAEMKQTLDGMQEEPSSRFDSQVGSLTDISKAMEDGAALIHSSPIKAPRVLLNIIGNGEDNVGESPARVRQMLMDVDININGVVIGKNPMLVEYFQETVVGGPSAFVISVDSSADLPHAFMRKFFSEIAMVGP